MLYFPWNIANSINYPNKIKKVNGTHIWDLVLFFTVWLFPFTMQHNLWLFTSRTQFTCFLSFSVGVSCGNFNWWENSSYTNEWSNCPSFSPFMSGLKRITANSAHVDTLVSIVGMKCCNVTNINFELECMIDNRWIRSFDT